MKTMNKLYLLQFDKFQCTINFLLWSSKDLIFKKIILKFKSCYYSNVLHASKKNKKKYLNHFDYYTTEIHLIQTPNFQFIDLLNHTTPFKKQKKTSNFLILNQTKKIANFPIA